MSRRMEYSARLGPLGCRGVTLVELMIALAISSILIVGVVQLFSNMRNAYVVNESLSRIQENGRFSMGFMGRQLRMAGYLGCERMPPTLTYHGNTAAQANDLLYRFDTPIEGWDYAGTGMGGGGMAIDTLTPAVDGNAGNWSPGLDADLAGEVIPGSDVIAVRFMDGDGIQAVQPGANGGPSSPPTFAAPDHGFEQDDIVLVTDCSGRAVVGEIRSSSPNQVTFGNGQMPQLGNPATMNRARTNIFYVGRGTDDVPALFVRSMLNGGNADDQELISGVETMQILYGVDTNDNGHVDQYRDAGQVAAAGQWPLVRSARISLLMRGHVDVPGMTIREQINVLGIPFDLNVGEGRQRRVFTTTVQFRNRARNN